MTQLNDVRTMSPGLVAELREDGGDVSVPAQRAAKDVLRFLLRRAQMEAGRECGDFRTEHAPSGRILRMLTEIQVYRFDVDDLRVTLRDAARRRTAVINLSEPRAGANRFLVRYTLDIYDGREHAGLLFQSGRTYRPKAKRR